MANSTFRNTREPDRKLKIAYMSGYFSQHPDGKALHAIAGADNKSEFEVHCLHDNSTEDKWTKWAREKSDRFTKINKMNDAEFEAFILDQQIDIIIEATGHTGGKNRLGALATRVAPIQVSFLAYPTTTGLKTIDYRITDGYCDPIGKTERLHTEKLIRMQRGFICFLPPEPLPPVVEPPFRRNGFVTFGSFNNPSKVSQSALTAWARILREVPDSRLVVKYGKAFTSDWLREQWRNWRPHTSVCGETGAKRTRRSLSIARSGCGGSR